MALLWTFELQTFVSEVKTITATAADRNTQLTLQLLFNLLLVVVVAVQF